MNVPDPSVLEIVLAVIALVQGWHEVARRRDRKRTTEDVRQIVREEIAPPAQLLTGLAQLASNARDADPDDLDTPSK